LGNRRTFGILITVEINRVKLAGSLLNLVFCEQFQHCLSRSRNTCLTFSPFDATDIFMGMDGVEIVMAAEDAFDIHIEDAEAERILTPRQLIDLVMAKVANVETNFCLTHRAFNLLRKFMVQGLGFPRKEITPTAKLSKIFPKHRRKDFLREFRVQLGTGSVPGLVAPGWFQVLTICFALAGGLAAAVPASLHLGAAVATIAFMLGAFVSTVTAIFLSRSFATEFPNGLSTLGDLSLWVRNHKPDLADKSQKAWTREQAAARVREIVIETLCCETKYSEDARFVQDLGLS
jgi:hypothetical protein